MSLIVVVVLGAIVWSERLIWNLGIGTATILAGIALSVVGSVVSADPPQRP
jgi:drug/metabolite transporter (DMT)-like permease